MGRKIKIILTGIIFILFFVDSYAQPWLKYLPKKETYTLTDFRQAFSRYVKDYKELHPYLLKKGNELNEESIPGYFQFKRWEWYWKSRVNPITKEFPDYLAFDVIKQMQSQGIKSVGGTWQSLGPANIDLNDRGTGRINCAAFDPNNDLHFWIGAPAGGVWETTDGGQTWTCLTDNNQILGVSDIALPPDYDATTNPVIYIATGDRDALDDPSIGILKTTDGGQTWVKTGLSFKPKEQVKVSRIIIDPNDKNTIWAATSVGIYKSTDAGNSWTLKQSGNFIDMELIPNSTANNNPGHLIATTYGTAPKAFLSTDDGETWNATFNGSSSEFRCDVAIAPSDPNRAYIITGNASDMGLYGIYKSTDGGQSWTMVWDGQANNHNLYSWDTRGTVSQGGQAFYDVALAVSNTNPDVLYVGGVNSWISTDGGNSFNPVTCWTSDSYYNTVGAPVIHADHHNAYFRPSDNRLFDVNDGGIQYSDNPTAGKNSNWTNITAGLVNGQVYGIGVADNVADEVIAGLQDNGTKLLDAGASLWQDVKGGDGMNCDIDPTDDNVQWGTYVRLQIDYTTDKWASSPQSIRASGNAQWAGPLQADPREPNTIYIGTDRVEKYVGSQNTDMTGTALDGTNYMTALDVYNDGNNLVIWASSPSGVWRSDNTGHNYVKVSDNGLPPNEVTDIAIDPNDYNHVYVCMGSYDNNVVYETFDGGQTWQNISDGLPPVPAGAIAINKQNTSVYEVYVGTDAGIWVKYGNNPWQLFNTGIPFVSITDLDFHYDNNNPANTKLFASTYGRGIWVSDCYQPPNLDAALSKIIEPADQYCDETSITPSFQISGIGNQDITSFTIAYQIDGGAIQTKNWTGTLSQGQSVNVSFSPITLTYGTHSLKAYIYNINGGNDQNQNNDTLKLTINVWNNQLPYTQTFDDFSLSIGYSGTSVNLEQCWTNDETESNLDWSVNQGETPSSGTGPNGDHTSGTGKYLYTEVSGAYNINVYLLTPHFNLQNWQNCQMEFYYCMNGSDCGTLGPVSYSTDGGNTWTDLNVTWQSTGNSSTTISGNQGSSWFKASANLSAIDQQPDVIIRIASTTGNNYAGDIAIDDFSIWGDQVCTPPSTQASNIQFTPDYNSMTIQWTRGTGDAVLVVMRQGSNVNTDPVSGNTYNANSTFGNGDQIGAGNYVVYNGSGNSVTVTGLQEGQQYYVAIYEYNTVDNCYLIPGATASSTTLIHDPQITSVSPSYIYADLGGTITINGNYFNNITSVKLGGIDAANYTVVNSNTITATFNPAPYSGSNLEVTNNGGTTSYTFNVKTRNIIPVGTGTDMHPSITSALNGLSSWWQSNAFDTAKVIEVYNGTYQETITPPTGLNPDANHYLIIRAANGEHPTIDATGLNYGINNSLNYCEFSGFDIKNATTADIYSQGTYNIIKYNRITNTSDGDGIYLKNASNSQILNNLIYDNYGDGIKIEASDNTSVINNTTYGNGHNVVALKNVTIYYEDFETSGAPGWYQTNSGGSIIDYSGSPNYYVSPTHSIGSYTDNTIYKKYAIDVSGYTNLTISTWGRNDGYMLSSEYIKAEYSFDNTNWTTFLDLSGDVGQYTYGEASGITPGSDSLYIRYVINVSGQGSTSYWWIADDYKVTGDQTGISGQYGAGLHLLSGSGYNIRNNIFTSKNNGDYVAIQIENNASYTSDYNLYYSWGNTNLIKENGNNITSLADWTNAGTNDISSNPLFVDTTARDFHIQSVYGSYHSGEWPPLTANNGSWTTDAATSPGIDAGDPASDYFMEPQSGNRINLGAYGNTPQASKSQVINIVWTGSVDQNWNNASNWQNNIIPSSDDDVIIPSGCPNYPNINSAIQVKSITLQDKAQLTISSGGNFNVSTSLIIGENSTDSAIVSMEGGSVSAANLSASGKSLIKINSGNISANTVSLAATSYVKYNGSANQNIYNWKYGNLILEGTGNKYITGDANNPTYTENLIINTSSLVIPEGKALTVNGKTINKEGINGLTIKSTSSGDGSLIQNTPNVRATVERYLTGTQWHYIGPPVKGANINLFNTNNFYVWDATKSWQGLSDYSPWIKYQKDTLFSAIGYAYYYYETTINYQDTLNTGSYTITLHNTPSSDVAYEGWNLISNPYPCSLDLDQLVNQPAFQNGDVEMAFYFFDDASKTGQQSNYRYYVASNGTATGVGTNNATNIVPMGQAFFVKAYTDGTQIIISPQYCVHGNQAFYKKSTTRSKNMFKLSISDKNNQDEIIYRLVDDATKFFDKKYDAIKKFTDKYNVTLFFLTPDKQYSMAIASDNPQTDYTDIFLGYTSPDDTLTIRLNADDFDQVNNIYLEDKVKDTIINLKKQSYTFVTSQGHFNDRFILHFTLNHAPIIANKEIFGLVNQQIKFSLPPMYDPDYNDKIVDTTFSLLPQWLIYNDSSKTFSGIPSKVGKYNFKIIANDRFNAQGQGDITITIQKSNDTPKVVGKIPDIIVFTGESYKYKIPQIFEDPDSNKLLYKINMADGSSIPEFIRITKDPLMLTLTPKESDIGTYKMSISAKDPYGSQAQTNFYIIVQKQAINQIEPSDGKKTIVLYPNPAYNYITVTYNGQETINKIALTDASGKQYPINQKFSGKTFTINTQNLASGLYILEIKTQGGIYKAKFIKK